MKIALLTVVPGPRRHCYRPFVDVVSMTETDLGGPTAVENGVPREHTKIKLSKTSLVCIRLVICGLLWINFLFILRLTHPRTFYDHED